MALLFESTGGYRERGLEQRHGMDTNLPTL